MQRFTMTRKNTKDKFQRRAIEQHKRLVTDPYYRHRVIRNKWNDLDIIIAKEELKDVIG